jgi:hypothetical protein
MSSLIATTAKAQNDFETSQSDAFAAPGFHLASGNCGIRAEYYVGSHPPVVVPFLDNFLVLFDVILPFAFGPRQDHLRDWQ